MYEASTPTVLIVDDSPIDRVRAERILTNSLNCQVHHATDGSEALQLTEDLLPDIVVTDLQMPEMDGLELLKVLQDRYPGLPVILMTARGSEDIATQALIAGASSYVAKANLPTLLAQTVGSFIAARSRDRAHSRLMHALETCHSRFVIENDPELFEMMVEHLQEEMRCLPLGSDVERVRIAMALRSALLAVHYYGNLEIDRSLTDFLSGEFQKQVEAQLQNPTLSSRQIVLESRIDAQQAEFVIRFEGRLVELGDSTAEGDLAELPESDGLERSWVLMNSSMDELELLDDGRTLRMCKRARVSDDCVLM